MIPVLQQLWGLPLSDLVLAYVAALRPSAIRVTGGEVKCNSHVWRVTVFVDGNDVVTRIEQEVDVLYSCGAEVGECLRAARDKRMPHPPPQVYGNLAGLARVNFDGSGLTLLTEGDGAHSIEYSPDGRFLIDTYSRVDLPPVTELRRSEDGKLVCELERADITALRKLSWQTPEPFVAKGRDGQTDIYGVIFRPTNFDPNRRYPVIEQIYAGPQSAFVPKGFRAYHGPQGLAELGFVEAKDPRFIATVAAVERDLVAADGLVLRYDSETVEDGLPPGEGAFLACSFWLANAYVLLGREADAVRLFDKLQSFCNDLGLLSEEYDTRLRRQAGNFPQALSHIGLLSTALNLTNKLKPSVQRADGGGAGEEGGA